MGNLNSTARLTEPVTLPRIWNACQYESSMPPELSKFTIELLADDMNKLGANIPTSGSRDSICRAIHDYLPQAEKVCMVGKDSVSKEKVYRMVELFNNQYGSRIPLYNNGYDGKDGYRPIADLCDDMYSVQKRVTRSLEKNTLEVKAKLINSIAQLRTQQATLDAEFNNYRNLMTKGKNLDGLRGDIRADLANQQKVVMNMKQQQAVLNSMYGQFIAGIQPVSIANAGNVLPAPMLMTGGAKSRDSVDSKYIGKLLTSTLNTGIAQQQVLDCFKNMNTTYEEYLYHAYQPDGELERWIKHKEYEAIIDPVNADFISQSVIGSCAVALVEQKNKVLSKEYVASEFKSMASDSCSAHNKFPHPELRLIECNRDQLCSWINGSCQIADQKRNGPADTADRFITFNPYTIKALGSLREVIHKCSSKLTVPDREDCVVYSNKIDDAFVRKLFTEIFNKKVAVFDSLGRMVETSSADYEGTKVTKYMSKIYDDLLLGYARFLIRTYNLNVIVDKGQDTLLAEAFDAYVNNKTINKQHVRNSTTLPTYDEWEQSLNVYAESPELSQILNHHNMVVGGFLNQWV